MNVEFIVCEACGYSLPISYGIPNFAEELSASTTHLSLAQRIMETRAFASIYESPIWRPLHTFVSTGMTVKEQLKEFVDLSGDQSKEVILDLACGTGHFTRAFAKRWPEALIFGLDLSFSMLRKAVALARKNEIDNVLFMRGNIFRLPFEDGTVDQVNSCGALHLFEDQPAIWKEISRVLKPGGMFTVEAIAIDPKIEGLERFIMRTRGFHFLEPEVVKRQLQEVGIGSMEYTQRKMILTFRSVKEETPKVDDGTSEAPQA